MTFGLTAPYMLLPVGFGAIFLNDILLANINDAGQALGLEVSRGMVPLAMGIAVAGMAVGLSIALLFSYRKPRDYPQRAPAVSHTQPTKREQRAAQASTISGIPWCRLSFTTTYRWFCLAGWRPCGCKPHSD